MRALFATIITPLVLGASLCGCQQADLGVSDAWVRLPASSTNPAAAYFIVRGGGEDTSLLAVSSPAAIRTALNEMQHDGQVMKTTPVKDIAIPAGAVVKLEPAGKHAMLYDISPTVRAGGTIPLRIAFANGQTIEVEAAVRAVGQEK